MFRCLMSCFGILCPSLILWGQQDEPGRIASTIPWPWILATLGVSVVLALLIAALAHRRYRTLHQSLASLFHALDEGLCLLDSTGRITAANRMFAEFFDTTPDRLQGQSMTQLLSVHHLDYLIQPFEQLCAPPLIPINQEISLPYHGKTHYMLVSMTPLVDNGRSGPCLLLSFKDISQVVRSKRAVAWASMAQKLAHEIKTPLSTIMLSAQRLQGDVSQRQAKYLGHIIDQVNRLRDLTDGLLKFARIENPVLNSTDINRLFQEVLEGFRLNLGPDITIDAHWGGALPLIRADESQLRIALGNLIANAMTAMSGRGTLTLVTRLVQELHATSQQQIQIEISDTGKGISAKAMSRLFEPFYFQSPGGTGLGLVIVKKIIEDHWGRIEINSQEGVGTTVLLHLPVNPGDESATT